MTSLAGVAALVTGAGRGIGRAIALRYAKAGARVLLVDIDNALLQEAQAMVVAAGGAAVSMQADLREPSQSSAVVAKAVGEFGQLDVMVNNAGVVRVTPFLEVKPEDWDYVNDLNARGLFFAMQAGARQMVTQPALADGRPRGKIINVASIAGRNGRPMFAAYAASKAAVISMTQSAALALAPGVTVNAICPGIVDTEMWRTIDREWSAADNRPVGSAWQDRIRGIPLRRPETPEDLTGMALYLAGADSDYCTGQAMHVDGGVTMY